MITQEITLGDRRRPAIAKLVTTDEAGVEIPVDLSPVGTQVKFRMVLAKSPYTVKVNNAAAFIEDAVNGKVRYEWQALDVDTKGEYFAWFIVLDPAGLPEHFPTGYQYSIKVHPIDGTGINA